MAESVEATRSIDPTRGTSEGATGRERFSTADFTISAQQG